MIIIAWTLCVLGVINVGLRFFTYPPKRGWRWRNRLIITIDTIICLLAVVLTIWVSTWWSVIAAGYILVLATQLRRHAEWMRESV